MRKKNYETKSFITSFIKIMKFVKKQFVKVLNMQIFYFRKMWQDALKEEKNELTTQKI